MTGIVVAGVGIGGIVAPPVISRLINAYDWRVSFMVQGGFALLVLVAAAQFLRSARNGTARQRDARFRWRSTLGRIRRDRGS